MLKIVYGLFLCLIGIIANPVGATLFLVSDEATLKAAVQDANTIETGDDIIDLQGNTIVLTSADNT